MLQSSTDERQDRELKELSRVELDCGSVKKDAHDVLIHGGTALLLDKIMAPIFLFRVDVQDPKNLTVRQRIESFGINAHLKLQWVVPEKEAWFVVEEFHTMSGFGQELRIYHTDRGEDSVANPELIFNERKEESGLTGDGFWISAATSNPPMRTIVAGRDLPRSLALVTFDGAKASIEPDALQTWASVKIHIYSDMALTFSWYPAKERRPLPDYWF